METNIFRRNDNAFSDNVNILTYITQLCITYTTKYMLTREKFLFLRFSGYVWTLLCSYSIHIPNQTENASIFPSPTQKAWINKHSKLKSLYTYLIIFTFPNGFHFVFRLVNKYWNSLEMSILKYYVFTISQDNKCKTLKILWKNTDVNNIVYCVL